jgi:hypothetical protein
MDRRPEVIIKSQTRKNRRDQSWPDSSKPRTQHHRARKRDTAAPCKIAAGLTHRRGFDLAITPAPANRNVIVCNKILTFRKARLRRSGLVEQCQPSLARRKWFRLIQHTAQCANISTDREKFPPRPRCTETFHPPFLSTISHPLRPSAAFGAPIALFPVVGRWDQCRGGTESWKTFERGMSMNSPTACW